MRISVLVAMVTCLTTACVDGARPMTDTKPWTEPPSELVDPTGVWRVRITWELGTCGLIGSTDTDITVVRDSTGTSIKAPQSVTVTGYVACTVESCAMSVDLLGPGSEGVRSMEFRADLSVNGDGAISGSGDAMYTFTNGNSCRQPFSAGGVLL